MGKYYSEHELLNNMYDIVDEDGCILTVLDKDTLKSLPPLMPVRQPVHAHNASITGFLCSKCLFGDFGLFKDYTPRYCPNCGAKMDEGGRD